MINLIFPPLCLHCKMRCEKNKRLFCTSCASFFELIDPSMRCIYCFSENDGSHPCKECMQKKLWQIKIASALDYQESVHSLVKKLKYGRMPYLAKTGSAFMLAQFARLNWEVPDVIVPVPPRHWFQGMNHAFLLAQCLAKSLQVPCIGLVGRRSGDYSQARLHKNQREALASANFYLKRNDNLEGKIILLIDDVMTTGTTIRNSAEVFSKSLAAKIYALTLARTM